MFAPEGAHTTPAWNGFSPDRIAWGHHSRSHTYNFESALPSPMKRDPRCERTRTPNIRTEMHK